ncbi:unnamed protein product [Caenorhabditis auriculariae]|uniref:Uncharacterized protein n=1 Tax=Caenorhabditis auriculariae TaxID=2777116 RepID=A0A8S1HTZ4_9PELO|nr:unnamed protein product [Caenorhabditis auriculariae]
MGSASKEEAKKYAEAGNIAEEAITSIRTVVAFNGQPYELDRYSQALAICSRIGVKKGVLLGVGIGMTFLIGFSSYCFTFWLGTNFIYDGKMDGNTVMTVFFSVMLGAMALGQAGPQIAAVATAQGAAGVLYELIDREPEIDAYSPEGVSPARLRGEVTVQNVCFSYPRRPDITVLNNVSFTTQPGKTVALVGASGCGKSTIIQLLLRYYDVTGGKILIDGLPLTDYNIEYLRSVIGVVSQEPVLFNTTIEQNIRFGRADVSEEEIWAALKKANAYRFVQQLPQGLKTLVGDRGTQMSGGQKQRIAIARALVRDPKILLLDEATSALDAESESVVQHALENASKGRTTIVIAHRLSTVRNADTIIAVKEGKVVEQGTHDELIKSGGLYSELVKSQIFVDVDEQHSKRTGSIVSQASRANSVSVPTGKEDEAPLKPEQELERMKKDLEMEGAKPAGLFEILARARPEWKYIAIAIIFSCIQGCVYPAFSFFFSQMIEAFAKPPDQMKKEGHFWALMFIGLGLVELVTFIVTCFLYGLVSERLTRRLRCQVFQNVLSMDGAFFDSPQNSSGKISIRLATDAPNVKAAIDNRFGSVFASTFSLIVGIGIGIYFGWEMALMCMSIFPLGVIGQTLQMRYMSGNSSLDPKEMENGGKIAIEAIEHVRTVQALTLQPTMYQSFCESLNLAQKAANRRHVYAVRCFALYVGLGYGFSASIFFFLFAASFRFGLWLVQTCHMLPFDMLKVLFAISFTAGSMGYTSSYFTEYTKATVAAGLIFNMLKKKPRIDNMSKNGKRPAITGRVHFDNVFFKYPERPSVLVLGGLNIEVRPGETLALVGSSGCGKSTVISLLERLYDPLDGHVNLDGEDIREMNPTHLRSHIALVSQEPTLFDTSIRSNIVYGLEPGSYTEAQILDAAMKANIHKFVSELPEGYDTRVGEKGTQLSGGQKQRIAIARALIRNPRILLLDEATSALDTESEKLVQAALDAASQGRTCIVVAHRLSTVVNSNCIVVVHNGKAIEKGTHAELMSLRGAYWNLTQKQTLASS